jgi:cell wall-associated NlpC family hydrolase
MPRAVCLAAALAALAGCATTPRVERPAPDPRAEGRDAAATSALAGDGGVGATGEPDLPETAADTSADAEPARSPAASGAGARLAARARSLLGRRGPFRVGGERFNGDCSGFVQAVYAAEGIDLRARKERAAPRERRGVKAAWLAAAAGGAVLGAEATPAPGDLVFWHDTFDRNRNRRADDRLTHVGIVESVEGGTVQFLHRGGKGVARGVMTLARPHEASAPGGRRVNSVLRSRAHPVRNGGLAAQLFAGYGRIGGASVPAVASAGAAKAAPAAKSRAARAQSREHATAAKRKKSPAAPRKTASAGTPQPAR